MTSEEALQHLVARALENGTDKETAEAIEVLRSDAKELDEIRVLRAQISAKQQERAVYQPLLTILEAKILARVSLGLDPWGASLSGAVSRTLVHLKKKGFMMERANIGDRNRVTSTGDAALLETFAWYLRRGHVETNP